MARLSFRCDEDLVQRVDAERGLIPREAWLRRAIEQALAGAAIGQPTGTPDTPLQAPAERPYRQHTPGPNVENIRSSSQAKQGTRPIPKGKP